jgi:hypothetical protein
LKQNHTSVCSWSREGENHAGLPRLHAEGIGDAAYQRKVMSGAGIEFVLAIRRKKLNSFLLIGMYKNLTIKAS